MGWWSAGEQTGGITQFTGEEDKGMAWGDGPADTLDAALDDIAEQFQAAWSRKPTKAELRAGLEFSLGGMEE